MLKFQKRGGNGAAICGFCLVIIVNVIATIIIIDVCSGILGMNVYFTFLIMN